MACHSVPSHELRGAEYEFANIFHAHASDASLTRAIQIVIKLRNYYLSRKSVYKFTAQDN